LSLFAFLLIVVFVVFLASLLRQKKPAPGPIVRAQGTLVRLERKAFSLFDFYPVVRFKSPQGQWLTLCCKWSGRGQDLHIGQQVAVRYPAGSPEDFTVVSGLGLLFD
jgi:hypothetical protein